MSQQINLLIRKQAAPRSGLYAIIAIGVLLLGLAAFGLVRQRQIHHLQSEAEAEAARLAEAKAALQKRMETTGKASAEELAALKQKADAARILIGQIEALGSQEGYARQFSALAATAESGVWLTSIAIGQSGKTLAISGNAMNKESLMRYVQKLNDRFSDAGVQFTHLEISPVQAGGNPGAAPGVPNAAGSAVTFKLN